MQKLALLVDNSSIFTCPKLQIFQDNHSSEWFFYTQNLNIMELNTTNPHCFIYQTEELLIELLGGVRVEGLDRMRVTMKVTVGHTAVQVADKVYGYYPGEENGEPGWQMSELMGSTGVMQVESRADFDARYTSDGVTDFTLEVTQSQATTLGQNLEGRVTNPGTYSLVGDQCTSVACSSMQGAGINIGETVKIPASTLPMPGATTNFTKTAVSPSELKESLNRQLNKSIVTGARIYGGN